MKTVFRKSLWDHAKILFCAVFLAIVYSLFIVPNHFAPAGLNGIATMLQYKLGFSIGYFSLLINLPLCVLACFLIDRKFGQRSLLFCLVYSLSYLLLQRADLSRFVYDAQDVDVIFPCLIAGMGSGLVYGVCFRAGASTGGTDIVAKYVNKRIPHFNFFTVTFCINAAVAVASFFVYAVPDEAGELYYRYKPVVLCILYCFMSGYVGNRILRGTKEAYRFTVITSHATELREEIVRTLRHSATFLHGTGAYSGEGKEVILCVVNRNQLVEFETILAQYPDTFAFVEKVRETIGNFKKIPPHTRRDRP